MLNTSCVKASVSESYVLDMVVKVKKICIVLFVICNLYCFYYVKRCIILIKIKSFSYLLLGT